MSAAVTVFAIAAAALSLGSVRGNTNLPQVVLTLGPECKRCMRKWTYKQHTPLYYCEQQFREVASWDCMRSGGACEEEGIDWLVKMYCMQQKAKHGCPKNGLRGNPLCRKMVTLRVTQCQLVEAAEPAEGYEYQCM